MDLMQIRRALMLAGNVIDTTAEILVYNKVLEHTSVYQQVNKTNGCITIKYPLTNPTNILYPAGIIPTTGDVIARAQACIVVCDANGVPFNHVNENTASSGYNRWAQEESDTLTEYSQKWTLAQDYYFIWVSLDARYLDRAYLYDKQSGQVWFAGENTPYYGKRNIND